MSSVDSATFLGIASKISKLHLSAENNPGGIETFTTIRPITEALEAKT
jgi:hypothetical protein